MKEYAKNRAETIITRAMAAVKETAAYPEEISDNCFAEPLILFVNAGLL